MIEFKPSLIELKVSLHDLKLSLDDTKETLNDFKQSLNDTKLSLNGLKETLDDTKLILNDLKETLNGTKLGVDASMLRPGHARPAQGLPTHRHDAPNHGAMSTHSAKPAATLSGNPCAKDSNSRCMSPSLPHAAQAVRWCGKSSDRDAQIRILASASHVPLGRYPSAGWWPEAIGGHVASTGRPRAGDGWYPTGATRRATDGTRVGSLASVRRTLVELAVKAREAAMVKFSIVFLWVCLVLSTTQASGQLKDLLESRCLSCGADLNKANPQHGAGCKWLAGASVADDCARAAAFMKSKIASREVLSYTNKDIDELARTNCSYLVNVLAHNRGFKRAEDLQREARDAQAKAERQAREAREKAERQAREQAEADSRSQASLITDAKKTLKKNFSGLLGQASTAGGALHLAGQAQQKANDARAAAKIAESQGNHGLAAELKSFANTMDDAVEEAHAVANNLSAGIGGINDFASESGGHIGLSELGHELVLEAEEDSVGRPSRLGRVGLGVAMDHLSDPASVYGGIDPIGVATDNMDAMFPEGTVPSLVDPIRKAGEGIIKVFNDANTLSHSSPPLPPPPALTPPSRSSAGFPQRAPARPDPRDTISVMPSNQQQIQTPFDIAPRSGVRPRLPGVPLPSGSMAGTTSLLDLLNAIGPSTSSVTSTKDASLLSAGMTGSGLKKAEAKKLVPPTKVDVVDLLNAIPPK